MKIKNLEESGIVKSAIICNDIILLMVSYWFAFALTHSFALAFNFPYALKTELLIGALTIFPTFYIAPPVFLKRMVYGNDILGRSVYTVCLQTLFMIAAISLIRRMNVAGEELPEDMQLKNLGDRRMVMSYLRQHQEVTDLYMVPDTDYTAETDEIFRYCEDHMIRFYALPVFMEFLTKRMELSHLGSTMLLSVRNEPLQDPVNRGVKRLFDILTSGLFLLTVFPIVYLIAGIIIKIQSPGPILFKQKRNGLDGKEFYCLKFRSMHVNKDSDRIQATKNDPRKFKFGNLMRKTNIDELPQFINVFKGDMSLVGPRPHMLLHTQEYSRLIRRYMVRHLVKPGITGWAQVQGFRGETKTLDQMENRVKADIWYVENWSFGLDLRIMWRTLLNMLRHNEEYAY